MTKSKIERFELNEQSAIALIVIVISNSIIPQLSGNLISGIAAFIFILSLEIHFTFLLYLVLLAGGVACKITHQAILNLDASFYFVLAVLMFIVGLIWHAIYKNFQWNKLFIAISLIILQIGILQIVIHTSLASIDGNITVLIGCGLLLITYLFRFLLKNNKNLIDILKVAIVVSGSISYAGKITHQLILGFDWSFVSGPLILIWALSYFAKYLPKNPDDENNDILDYDLDQNNK